LILNNLKFIYELTSQYKNNILILHNAENIFLLIIIRQFKISL